MTYLMRPSRATQGGTEILLPELQGSPKQTNWAVTLRTRFLNKLDSFEDWKAEREATGDTVPQFETSNFLIALQNMITNHPIAKTWIEYLQKLDTLNCVYKVMEFYQDEIQVQEDITPAKGIASELLSVQHSEDGVCKILGKKNSGKLINTVRKELNNPAFPDEVLVNFNNDVYAFKYNGPIGTDIHWVGNYKQNIWSSDITEAQKTAMGVEAVTKTEVPKGEIFHEQYNKILACVSSDIPVYLVGPAGSGKNHTLEQVARELNLKFYFTNSVQQEHKLTGFIDAGGTFHETEFYKAFTNGGLFFLDEMDASIPEVLVLLNAAIANGYFEFPNGRAEAHIDFRVVAAGNTMGQGADDQYTGRLVLDQATLDRFCIIEFDYDIRVEVKLSNGNIDLVTFVRDLREQSKKFGIRATYSYRCIQAATKLEGLLSVEEVLVIAIVKGIDKDTLKTYQADESTKYGRALAKLQRAS